MAKIEDHLPWRPDLEFVEEGWLESAAQEYADHVIEKTLAKPAERDELIVALVRAGLYFLFGLAGNEAMCRNKKTTKKLRQEGDKEFADLLKVNPRNRPPVFSNRGLIWVMADAWEYFGRKPRKPAWDPRTEKDTDPDFRQICGGWIRRIKEYLLAERQVSLAAILQQEEPPMPPIAPPGRKTYRDTLDAWANAKSNAT